MAIAMKDVHIVLFALHVAAAQGTTLDPDGARTRALWDAVLPLSLPEPNDPPLTETWAVLVKMSEAYSQLAEEPVVFQPNTIRDHVNGPACGMTWH